MSAPPETPVIIGVGDVVNRSKKIEDAIEPLGLIVEAIQKALSDTALNPTASAKLKNHIDSLDVVRSWTWPYPDLPASIAERLGIDPNRRHYSEHGGNQPAYLLDEAARRVSKGENQVAIVTGGEALASREHLQFQKEKKKRKRGKRRTEPLTNNPSGRLCKRQTPPTTRLDQTRRRREESLLAHHPRTPT